MSMCISQGVPWKHQGAYMLTKEFSGDFGYKFGSWGKVVRRESFI